MSWLQVGCPHCPSQVNLPAAMADMEVACDACGKTYRVPTPAAPVLAAAGPLPPLAILRTPGLAGNTAGGISPIPRLPAPFESSSPAGALGESGPGAGGGSAASGGAAMSGAARSLPPPPQLRRGPAAGGAAGGGAPFPWELSPEARASAAAIFGDQPIPGDEDELAAVERRIRKERIRSAARWMMVGLGMLAMLLLVAFFLRR